MAFSPGLGLIPLAWAIFTLLCIIFCYFYAVAVGHLYPFVPSISNTGAKSPEGDIFAEAMNVSSIVCLLIMSIRYFQLKHRAASFYDMHLKRVNMLSLTAGLFSVLGVTLVANFPSAKDATASTVHDAGAILSFIAVSCYCATQTFLTWKLFCYVIDDRFSWIYRLLLTCITALSGSMFLFSSLFAYQQFKESHGDQHDILKWEPGDGGYHLHVFSNACEWVGASSFLLFIMSYFKEFQEVQVVTKCSPRNNPHDEASRSCLLKSNDPLEELQDSS